MSKFKTAVTATTSTSATGTNSTATAGAITAVALILLLTQQFPSLLCYDRQAILAGDYWRLLSGHWVHADWHHLLLNLAALALVGSLSLNIYSLRCCLASTLLCSLLISLGLLLLMPGLEWYVGLSAALHGLLAMTLVAQFRNGKPAYVLGLLLLAGKLLLEQFAGSPLNTFTTGELPVITAAHWLGTLFGLHLALLVPTRKPAAGNRTSRAEAK